MPAKCPPDGDGEKVELVRKCLQNEQLTADKTSRVGMVDGTGTRGRPGIEWLDDINE